MQPISTPAQARPLLRSLNWLRPHKSVRHAPGAAYATDGEYVYERRRTLLGLPRFAYRRAHWSLINDALDWAELNECIWEPVTELGKPFE